MLRRSLVVSGVLLLCSLALLAQDAADKKSPEASQTNSVAEHANEYIHSVQVQAPAPEREFPVVLRMGPSTTISRAAPATCSIPLLEAQPSGKSAENTIKPKPGRYKIRYADAPAPPCPRD